MRRAIVALVMVGLALVGPVERWTYTSNGEVVFVIVGDTVTLQAAGGDKKKP